MLKHTYSYETTLTDSHKVDWKVEDLIGPDKPLDFSKPFLPESLAGVRGLSSLSDREKLLLNQIRANGYLYLFQVAEEYVVPFVLDQSRSMTPGGNSVELRAMITFAEEEAKHVHLFRRFTEEFAKGFHTPCRVVGPQVDLSNALLNHSPIGVTLTTLALEWMTQSHYLDGMKDDQSLDPQFKNLLRHHWMEEAQHVKLDVLLLDKLLSTSSPEVIGKGFADFAAMGNLIDSVLQQQVPLDLEALEAASGRKLGDSERQEITAAQLRAHRYTFLVSAILHKNFLAMVEQINPAAVGHIREMARQLSN